MNVPVAVGVPLIVKRPPLYEPVTPAGRPVTPAPVPPPPIEYTMFVMAILWQIVWVLLPEVRLIVALGFTTCVLLSVATPQEPPLVVRVRVAVPKKSIGGCHLALRVVAFGTNVPPADDDQVPPVAEPPTLPPSWAEFSPWHIAVRAVPAFAVGSWLTVIASVLAELVPQLLLAVTDNVPEVAAVE